jgi:hypothetical protein
MTNSGTGLDLYSEPYGATGNIGENFRRLLGAPSIDPLQTVVREAVQNIADAAKLARGPEILIRLRTLTRENRDALQEKILRNLPNEAKSKKALQKSLTREDLAVLEICDFETIGLGGPTRPDRIPLGTLRTDFIDFVRNIGTARDTELGGGTYGFGKVALYRASRCSTIIVDTVPHSESGAHIRRLIACQVGDSFSVPANKMLCKYTGRHWWGTADEKDGVVDPVVGAKAHRLAAALGMPTREEGQSGTSIMILDFNNEEEDLESAGRKIVEALLWNFWPRMMQDCPRSRKFKCKVEVNNSALKIPKPEEFPPLDLFCKAMKAARTGAGNELHSIVSQRPSRLLGNLALERGIRSQRRSIVKEESLFPATAHHVALMRPVELVVKYLAGNPLPDENLEWAGVFLVADDNEVEQAFADSEPPAHDDWVPESLPKGNQRTFVNVGLKRIRERIMEVGAQPTTPNTVSQSGLPLAKIAGKLGAFLEGVGGDGASKWSTQLGSGGARPTRARATRAAFAKLELVDGQRIAVFTTDITQDRTKSGKVLVATASIAIDGASSPLQLDDFTPPSVLSMNFADDQTATMGAQLPTDGRDGKVFIRVLLPEEYAVILDVELTMEVPR